LIFREYTQFNSFAAVSHYVSPFSLIFQHFPLLPQRLHSFSFGNSLSLVSFHSC
jgi:hypothetical protein